ncbi:MAG: hypothetical protein J1F36_01960 [Clostridiales bacterium]|nr:hypothetical protein [Clostridiales bacterium]
MADEEKNEQQTGNETPNTENEAPQTETESKTAKKKPTYSEKAEFKTAVNDPDLLIQPYKPVEGEALTIKCPHCGEEMPSSIDTCVNCGHYLKTGEKRYKPMDEKKMKKIRWTIGIILMVGIIIYFFIVKPMLGS